MACLLPVLSLVAVQHFNDLLRLTIVLVLQGVVVLPCVMHSHNPYQVQMRERPRLFAYARTHRLRPLKHQRPRDSMETISRLIFFIAIIGSGAYLGTGDTAAVGWGRGLLATACFPFAAFNLLDAIIWRDAARSELLELVGVDVEQLMLKLGYHWSWARGWQKYGMN